MALSDYEETLKSFIHDDDKLVTYKWLSKEFEIHVNVAKNILEKYWTKHKNEKNIVATFLLMGQLNDNSIRIEVVKESNLNGAKCKFTNVFCEHIYSLQKSLEDIELLAFAGNGDLSYSAVKCDDKYIRNSEEIDSLRYVGNAKTSKNTEKVNDKNEKVKSDFKEKSSNESKPHDKINKTKNQPLKEKTNNERKEKNDKNESKNNESKEIKEAKEKKDEIDSEIKKTALEKKSSATNKTSNSKVNKVSKNPVQSKQSGFKNLFGKVPSKPTSLKPKESSTEDSQKDLADVKNKVEKTNTSPKNEEKRINKEIEQPLSTPQNHSNSKDETKLKSKPINVKRGKKRDRSQEKNASSKRKRIIVADSSEEESERSSNEEELAMEVEEEPPKKVKQRSPSPPAKKRENGKLMIRKTLDKTFKDEDGYLVTKRVHIYEAADESDEVIEEVKKQEEPQKPKPLETKKKQTTLMNFFKKA